MIHCITNNKEFLYASECDEKMTRKLSRAGNLLFPNCKISFVLIKRIKNALIFHMFQIQIV